MSSSTSIGRKLYASAGIQARLRGLVQAAVRREFPVLQAEAQPDQEGNGRELLLLWASAFTSVPDPGCQDAALRIALEVLQDNTAAPGHRQASALLLSRMSNRPTKNLAVTRRLLDGDYQLPMIAEMEETRRNILDLISLSSGKDFIANQFQRALWEGLESAQLVGATAPTSAGKSFLLFRWIEERIRTDSAARVAAVVPTRALVSEVEETLASHLIGSGLQDVWVSSIPSEPPSGVKTEVIVATQERYHLLLRNRPDWRPDLLVIDEAQKIGDGRRGVLLSQVVNESLRRNSACQVVMAGPLIENPEEFLDVGPTTALRAPISRTDVTVVQNLLWACPVKRFPTTWTLTAYFQGSPVPVGTFHLPEAPSSYGKQLPLVAQALAGSAPGNLLYANGAAEAEKYAKLLSDGLPEVEAVPDRPEIDDVIKLIKDAIHPRFVLVEHLRHGVAFHYGNLPTVVRTEVERLFKSNVVKWLVCTSTLMEGVNLPCRTLYVRGPRKGSGNPMSAPDFWNLAGRAGRWGVEFAGNIVCVDPEDRKAWPNGAPKRRENQRVEAVAKHVLRAPTEFIDYLKAGAPAAAEGALSEFESLYGQMATIIRSGRSLLEMPWTSGVEGATLMAVEIEIHRLDRMLSLPYEILARNPGISPMGMESLLRHLRTHKRTAEHLIPAPIETEDAKQSFADIMGICDSHLGPAFGNDKYRMAVAIVTIEWMRGRKLREIIQKRLDYQDRRGKTYKLGEEIRQVLDIVEQYARYKVPKYVGCFTDVLRHFLGVECADPRLAARVPDFAEALEFGVSQRTHVSLMMLGISRYSAIAIAEFTRSPSMTPRECVDWLRRFDADAYGLPSIVVREIQSALAAKGALLGTGAL